MKKYFILMTFLLGFNANAGLIQIDVDNTSVNVGDTITVSLLASSMEDFLDFAIDFNFDDSLFSYNQPASFTSQTSDLNTPDLLFDNKGFGVIGFDYFGFDIESGDLLLAKFELTAIADGISTFGLSNSTFYNANLSSIANINIGSSANISVPEPTTMVLFGLALAGISFSRRQKNL